MDQCVSCLVTVNYQKIIYCVVYACNGYIARRRLWNYLIKIKDIFSQFPCLISGDFNVLSQPA